MDTRRFWAKSTDDKSDKSRENAYHPLICHLIDVGASAHKLWEDVLPVKTKKRLAESFGLKDDLEYAGRLIAFLIGLHDLGKCSPPFALRGRRDKITLKNKQTERLLELYQNTECFCDEFKSASDVPHGFVTSVELPAILSERLNFPIEFAKNISEIVGGHHGTFAASGKLQEIKRSKEKSIGDENWQKARTDIFGTFAEVFEINGDFSHIPNQKLDNSTAMIFAGLTTVADWIGSNADYFKCKIEDSRKILDENFEWFEIKDYFNESKQKAAEALEKLGWAKWVKETDEKTFKELFPVIDVPRHLQDMAVEISKEPEFNSIGIAVIESPTGEGKTEAAMFLGDAWNAKLGTRGIYFALPTQATSNQMFGRINEFLETRFKSEDFNVQLMLHHGHASISDAFIEKRENFQNIQNIFNDADKSDGFSNVAAAEWFTYKKRGLLVPFGVGTIDQILLAVLQTKHVFVRLFGLANKTVIIDEVHAYDAYMSTLLERLLEWLAALGSPVVILSATLPKNKRDSLIKAYLKGLGQFKDGENLINTGEKDEYPRISYATKKMPEKTFRVRRLNTSDQNTKTLYLEWKNEDDFVNELKKKLAGGGCAAIICNTVDKAQNLFAQLNEFFKEDINNGELDLLHARFRFKDREQREKQALLRFGKKGGKVLFTENGKTVEKTVKRPHRAVLISTQIIEQSLDLDFDLMISELAPADLLLQRAGRLQRHERDRFPAFKYQGKAKATLWLIKPPTDANGDLFVEKNSPDFGVSGIIYDKHILLRSWLKLKDENEIEVPADVEDLIEDVYDEDRVFENLTEDVLQIWRETLKICRYNRKLDKNEAQIRYVSSPHYEDDLGNFIKTPKEEDAPELHPAHQAQTRLIEPTATVVCLWKEDGELFADETYSEPISLSEKPSDETAKKLLFNSLTVSSKSVVFQLLREEIPSGWEKSAVLRRHRVLKFGAERKCAMFGYEFHLDENLGLRITKQEKK